jgi:hypothetical protein
MARGMSILVLRQGRVIDASGVSLPGIPVVIAASTVPMPEIALITGADGRFALRLPPGRFTFLAHGPEGETGQVDVEGAPDTTEILIRLGGKSGSDSRK